MNFRHKVQASKALLRAAVLGHRVPLAVSYVMTDRCNYQCPYCYRWRRRMPQELSLDEIARMLAEFKRLGTRLFKFTGGEPLLREDLPEVLRLARNQGFMVGLNTNGSLLPQRPEVLDYVTNVTFSLDGPPEVHEQIRPKGSFEAVMRAIDLTQARGVPVILNCTLNKYNTGCVDYLVDLVERKDVGIRFQPAATQTLSGEDADPLVADPAAVLAAICRVEQRLRTSRHILNWPVVLKFMKAWPRPQGLACAGYRLFCRVDPKGDLLVCGRWRHAGDAYPNVVRLGVRQAFDAMAEPICNRCYNHTRLRINILYSLLRGNRDVWRRVLTRRCVP